MGADERTRLPAPVQALERNREGGLLLEQGDLEGARDCFFQALEAAARLPAENTGLLAGVCNNLGHVHVRLKAWEQALDFFERAALALEKAGDIPGAAWQLANQGSVHRDGGNPASALEKYHRALALFESQSLPVEAADQHANIAYIHGMTHDLSQARLHYEQALAAYKALGQDAKAAMVEHNLKLI